MYHKFHHFNTHYDKSGHHELLKKRDDEPVQTILLNFSRRLMATQPSVHGHYLQTLLHLHHTKTHRILFTKSALIANLHQLPGSPQPERCKRPLDFRLIRTPLLQGNQLLNLPIHPLHISLINGKTELCALAHQRTPMQHLILPAKVLQHHPLKLRFTRIEKLWILIRFPLCRTNKR